MTKHQELTKEQVEAWQQQQEEANRQAELDAYQKIADYAASLGFEIVAAPGFTPDGRIGAIWGVQRKEQ